MKIECLKAVSTDLQFSGNKNTSVNQKRQNFQSKPGFNAFIDFYCMAAYSKLILTTEKLCTAGWQQSMEIMACS